MSPRSPTSYGLDQFAVVGRSGGGPHALACAALLSDRVSRAAVLVSLAPREADGLDWFGGMADSNVDAYAGPGGPTRPGHRPADVEPLTPFGTIRPGS